jgi:hypothetical protein
MGVSVPAPVARREIGVLRGALCDGRALPVVKRVFFANALLVEGCTDRGDYRMRRRRETEAPTGAFFEAPLARARPRTRGERA